MGQQQLLLIVLSVIIVGVAIAVGVNQFQGSAQDANRQAVIADLVNYASKAQRYFRTPAQLGGGEQDFGAFVLSNIEETNANGDYDIVLTAPTTAANVTAGATGAVTGTPTTIYIVGSGREIGNDGTLFVNAYVTVTQTGITTTILN
jgi:Tfp pilus assembly protein PilE